MPIVVADRMRETGKNAPEMLALADRYGLAGSRRSSSRVPASPRRDARGLGRARDAAFEFLKTAQKRFLDLEKKAALR